MAARPSAGRLLHTNSLPAHRSVNYATIAPMKPARLEAFSDGVIAIIITIMVIELHPPTSTELSSLFELGPGFFSYILSFLIIAIYWLNHHHLIHHVATVTPRILWSNMYLLFWLSLFPFATAYMGDNHFGGTTVTIYAFVSLMSAVAYLFLDTAIRMNEHVDSHGGHTHRSSRTPALFIKNYGAIIIYSLALLFSFFAPYLSLALVCIPAAMYFIPQAAE